MSKLRDMKKRFLPLSMLLITIVLAQASFVANATGIQGKYTPRTGSKATFSSFMKSIRANQETGLIDPADLIAAQKAVQAGATKGDMEWTYAGPDNYGGLTRAVIYRANGTVIIGTMCGDIYETTNGGITFRKLTSLNLPISCMVSAGDTIFIGTGDGRDAQNFNGLSTIGYENSFIGRGVYKMVGNSTPELLVSTEPSPDNGWGYVNELTYVNGKLYAATVAGIMMSVDYGRTWENIFEGNFRSVKSNNAGDILAAAKLDGKKIYKETDTDTTWSTVSNVYLLKATDSVFVKITGDVIPYTALSLNDSILDRNPKIIAMSPSNPNYMYIAFIDGEDGDHSSGNIYYTADGGAHWNVALAATSLYPILSDNADYEGFLIVYPNNPKKLLLGSANLWLLEDITGNDVFRPLLVSQYFTDEYSQIAWNRFKYLHRGIQTIAFNPNDSNVFFIGTNGGVYKGEYYEDNYSYKNCNRYFLTASEHTSTARMMAVGISGSNKCLGGCLDHGTIEIIGSESINNVTTGSRIFPHPVENGYTMTSSYFDEEYAGGPCAISTIDPDVYFVSGTGSLTPTIFRSETAGDDYNMNFEGEYVDDEPVIVNANAFKTPYAFVENYNDANNPLTIYAPIRTLKHVGETVFAFSQQRGYPVDHIITELPPQDTTHYINGEYVWIQGDTICDIHDPISTLFVCGIEGGIYMTRDALIFNKITEWLLIGEIEEDIPSAVALSQDGDMAIVGTVEGNLYKVTGLSNVYSEEDINLVTFTTLNSISSQAVTGISIDPTNSNNVLVSLGNYGNEAYIYHSTNGGNSFTSVQGDLPVAPIYSCLIEKSTGMFIAGTENGVYISDDGATWTQSGEISCPVMDIKQAVQQNHDDKIDVLYDEMGVPTYVVYPGVSNEGMIYAATYGAGIISSNTFKADIELSIDENEEEAKENVQLNIYPNPIRNHGNINITLTENAKVSYQIYDLSGRMVANSELGYYGQGEHTMTFDVSNLTSGSYIIRLQAGSKSEIAKILVY